MSKSEFHAEDEVLVLEAKKRAKTAAKQEADDLKTVMSTVQGRRFVMALLDRTGLFRTSFTGNASTYFNEGRRDVGLRLLADINEQCPELYLTAQQEHLQEATNA